MRPNIQQRRLRRLSDSIRAAHDSTYTLYAVLFLSVIVGVGLIVDRWHDLRDDRFLDLMVVFLAGIIVNGIFTLRRHKTLLAWLDQKLAEKRRMTD